MNRTSYSPSAAFCIVLGALLLLLAAALQGQVTFSPQPIAFGTVKLGQTSAVDTVVLKNTGTVALNFCGAAGCVTATGTSLSRMVGSGDFRYVDEDGKCTNPFAAGATCKLWYRFTPTSVGNKTGGNIVATSLGEFTINFVGTAQDTVTQPPPSPVAAMYASPIAVTLQVGQETPIEGVPLDSLGRGLALPTIWTSSSPAVATVRTPYDRVSQAAVLETHGAGSAVLTAASGGKLATIGVTVTPVDTTRVALDVTGFQVLGQPTPEIVTFPTRTVWSGFWNVLVFRATGDTIRASVRIANKP